MRGRERSDQARGSEATERGEGVGGGCPPSHGRESFQFLRSESNNLGACSNEIFYIISN